MAVRAPEKGGRAITAPDESAGSPFIKPEHLKGKTVKAKIVAVRDGNSQFGEGWNLDLLIGKQPCCLTVRENSGNHRRLYERFGVKWVGKSISLEVKEWMGQAYIAVSD